MAENFPNLINGRHKTTDPENLENTKPGLGWGTTLHLVISQTTENQRQTENLETKARGGKKHFIYRTARIRITLDFSLETIQTRSSMKYL